MDKNFLLSWPLSTLKSLFLLVLIIHTAYRLTGYSAGQPEFYGYLALLLALLSTSFRPTEFNLHLSAFVSAPTHWCSISGGLLGAALCCAAIAIVVF